jgi:hypothetical protein
MRGIAAVIVLMPCRGLSYEHRIAPGSAVPSTPIHPHGEGKPDCKKPHAARDKSGGKTALFSSSLREPRKDTHKNAA